MTSAKPTREQADLADVLELVLDKGIVINADIAITVGDTEMIGIELRAAIASFETAAEYGLAFPSGTDMRRVEQASGREPLEGEDEEAIDLGIGASEGDSSGDDGDSRDASQNPPRERPDPEIPIGGDESGSSDGDDGRDERGDQSSNGGADDRNGDEGGNGEPDADDGDASGRTEENEGDQTEDPDPS